MEPLERGFGLTLATLLGEAFFLRFMALLFIPSVKIDGVLHEFSNDSGVKEDTTELLLNLKELHVKSFVRVKAESSDEDDLDRRQGRG